MSPDMVARYSMYLTESSLPLTAQENQPAHIWARPCEHRRRRHWLERPTWWELHCRSTPRMLHHPVTHFQPLPRGPDDPAFVLFTSATTGSPNGTVIGHAAICSSIIGYSSILRFSTGTGSHNLQSTAYMSDVNIGDKFTSFAMGSCVCTPSHSTA